MIYTIGNGESYRKGIKVLGKEFKKVGYNDVHKHPFIEKDYAGGYAFLTKEDAQRRIDEIFKRDGKSYGFEVFGLEADWEKDTAPSNNGWWHFLLTDSKIVLVK